MKGKKNNEEFFENGIPILVGISISWKCLAFLWMDEKLH
jgi:hypothetical protein